VSSVVIDASVPKIFREFDASVLRESPICFDISDF
jgi:hypothetical protein